MRRLFELELNGNRKKFLWLGLLLVTSFVIYGYAGGISGKTRKNGNKEGCSCHGSSPSSNVTAVITGPSTVHTGEVGIFTLTITGGVLTRAGTDIAVSLGSLDTVEGSGLKVLENELTHFFPKLPSAGSVSFSFKYKAPDVESVDTIFANGNSVNFDITPFKDNWNYAPSKIITIMKGVNVNNIGGSVSNYSLSQNYPNPFNSRTIIRFGIRQKSNVKIFVYNSLGKKISELVNEELPEGNYQTNWDSENFPSDVYYYTLSTDNFSETKKMILIK